jgi:hypothetical protein
VSAKVAVVELWKSEINGSDAIGEIIEGDYWSTVERGLPSKEAAVSTDVTLNL